MKINCIYKEIVPLHKLVLNPKNTNKHPQPQIDLLAKILDYQGIRHPIIVSTRSGFICAGEGRYLAAIKNGWEEFPVDYQDFESEAQEYAFLESDNLISGLANHDHEQMIGQIKEMGLDVDFDLDLFGIPELSLDIKEVEIKEKELDENINTDNECPSCGYKW